MSKAYLHCEITILRSRLSDINTSTILQFAEVFSLDMLKLLSITDTILIIPDDNNIVNINHQINTKTQQKHKVINFTVSHAKLLNDYAEFPKPSSRILFQTIE